jgi:hypothetical protein
MSKAITVHPAIQSEVERLDRINAKAEEIYREAATGTVEVKISNVKLGVVRAQLQLERHRFKIRLDGPKLAMQEAKLIEYEKQTSAA